MARPVFNPSNSSAIYLLQAFLNCLSMLFLSHYH